MKQYLKPKSIAWWSGLLIVVIPVLRHLGVEIPDGVEGIFVGTGIIGVRAKL